MAYDQDLMANQLLAIANAERKKHKVRNLDTFTSARGSGSVPPSEGELSWLIARLFTSSRPDDINDLCSLFPPDDINDLDEVGDESEEDCVPL